MSLKTVASSQAFITLFIITVGLGAIVAIAAFAMRAESVPTTEVQPMKKIQREDDPARGVSCYWIYTGSGGGVALSCVALAADGGPR